MISICVVGVDGTGKSSVVKELYKYFGGNHACIQYMGLKNWETKQAKNYLSNKESLRFHKRIISKFVLIYEMYWRVLKHMNENKIVIFDRYVYERILFFVRMKHSWKNKFNEYIYKVAFGKLFYKPTITIYLTCEFETSLLRKDDIDNEKDVTKLKENKTIFDNYYMQRKDTIVINTSYLNIEETMKKIISILEEIECFAILMR